jgi:hypothetical protein
MGLLTLCVQLANDMTLSFRYRAFTTHLAASLLVLLLILGALYAGWYRWPGWYLAGAEVVVGLMVMVDVCLGPLGTLVISNPLKPRREWRRDIGMIVAVQLLALAYGTYTLWAGRPIFYAFSLNQIEMVRAADFKEEHVRAARDAGAPILSEGLSPVRWIWAPLPDDPELQSKIIASTMVGGDDVTVMPQYFRPWEDARTSMNSVYLPLTRLSDLTEWSEAEYARRLADLNRAPDELGVLPAKGSRRDGAWIFDRKTATPLAFWPVAIWDLGKR